MAFAGQGGQIAGPITAPSVPASTVAQTNSNPFACLVTVFGGTVTVIKIGGTTVSTIAGTTLFLVPAGSTIAITYAVAPTWTWYGL